MKEREAVEVLGAAFLTLIFCMLSIMCRQNIFVSSSHQAEAILAAAGAILGSGRGGCETSLCVGQNNFLIQNWLFQVFKSI